MPNLTPTHFVPNKAAGGGGGSKATTKVVIPKAFAMNSIFNSNANQFYKPHSLSVGVGSVRNARHMRGKT